MIETIIVSGKARRFDRRQLLFIVFTFCMVTTLFFLIAKGVNNADAGRLDNFRPGNIISDYVMSNYKSMTEAEIQAFLKSKNSCNDTRTYLAQQYPQYQYHIENGHFVCMADERFDGETAAHIIWQAAQDYKINPQVLIVLLQKEQSLVTDTWPNHIQYRAATGYGCPDTAACSEKYSVFKSQVHHAAEMFRTVLNGGWTNYPVGYNYVQYNPDASCGGSTVYIENLATSALYRYTPYQPNASAIAAGYGRGDNCGAYGNRNFYLYFLDWFGNPQGFSAVSTTFPEDDYLLALDGDYTKVLQLDTDSTENGVKFMMASRATADTFQLKKNANGTYTFIDKYSNKAVDISSSSYGTVIKQYDLDYSIGQQWNIYHNGDGTYSISPASNKQLVLSIDENEDSSTYRRLILSHYNYSANQSFRLIQVKAPVADGEYYISSKYDNKVLDVHVANNNNVWLYDLNYTQAQKWQVSFNAETGLYRIKNKLTNSSLDVTSRHPQGNINASPSHNNCSQLWSIYATASGYEIVSSCSGLAIDYAVSKNNNAQIWSRNQTAAQSWELKDVATTVAPTPDPTPNPTPTSQQILPDGEYYIKSALTSEYVFDLHIANYYNLWGYKHNSTLAQRWKLTYNSAKDAYNITSAHSNKNLDISSIKSGTNVFAVNPNKNCSQLWHIVKKADNEYEIISDCSDAVAIDYAVNQNRNIQIWSRNNTKAQRWQFTKI